MNNKLQIEITESQRSILIDYVCDYDIEKWAKAGRKLTNNKYGYPYNPPGFEVPYSLSIFIVFK